MSRSSKAGALAPAIVLQTFLRSDRERPPSRQPELRLERGVGIVGDCHRAERSPRQVLVASSGAYRRLRLDRNWLRENILIDVERLDWSSGTEVRIGTSVVLRVMFVCEPCAKLNAYRDGLLRELTEAGERGDRGDRGLLTRVVRGGVVREGDVVRVKPDVYSAFPDEWQKRLCRVLESLPEGEWISYVRLAELTGVRTSYCRVFPRVLRDAGIGVEGAGPTGGVSRRANGQLCIVAGRDEEDTRAWSGAELFGGAAKH